MKPATSTDPHNLDHIDTLKCYVCDIELIDEEDTQIKHGKKARQHKKSIKKGLITLSSQGTGFAGVGNNVVKKEGIVFQC